MVHPLLFITVSFKGDVRMSHCVLDEQIDHLRHSGISFEIMSESDAR